MKILKSPITMMIMMIVTMIGAPACTCAITLIHTQGVADDLIDETATKTPTMQVPPIVPTPYGIF